MRRSSAALQERTDGAPRPGGHQQAEADVAGVDVS
jgi:hypothetical protein